MRIPSRKVLAVVTALGGLFIAPIAKAQDTLPPIVFLHGFADWPGRWGTARTFLQMYDGYDRTDAFQLYTTTSSITSMGASVSSQIVGLPSAWHNPMLVGHSIGGVVARQASTLTPATALLTVGSPHYGHPALGHNNSFAYWYVLGTLGTLPWDLSVMFNQLNRCNSTRPGVNGNDIQGPCYNVWEYAMVVETFREFAEWCQQTYFPGPAVDDIQPGGQYVQTLNSASHVASESALERISVVGTLDSTERFASVFRAVGMDHDGAVFTQFLAMLMGTALIADGASVIFDAGWDDPWSTERAAGGLALMNLGVFVAGLSNWWNEIIGGWPNDGFVPDWTQQMPNSSSVPLPGYAHLEEPEALELIDLIDVVGKRHKR